MPKLPHAPAQTIDGRSASVIFTLFLKNVCLTSSFTLSGQCARRRKLGIFFYIIFDDGRLFFVIDICPPQQKTTTKKRKEKKCDCRGRDVCVFGKRDSRRRVSSARSLMSLAWMFGGWCDTVCSLVLRKSGGQAYLWHTPG